MKTEQNMGMRLLETGKRGLLQIVFSRMGLIILLLALHVALLFCAFRWFESFLPHIYGGAVLLTVAMVLYLLNSRMDQTAKITWLMIIMLLPDSVHCCFVYAERFWAPGAEGAAEPDHHPDG